MIVIGAGAAGMMCAATAGQRERSVWLLDHASKIGEKIRISGGGKCNFTNIHARPETFLSSNSHFCKSALKQYTQDDFIALVEKHGITYHEKDNNLGQLFCDGSSRQIIDMMLSECENAGVTLSKETSVESVEKLEEGGYRLKTSQGPATCESLVIATGGLSIPKIGASKFGYDIARQFGMKIHRTWPALVPLSFQANMLDYCKSLSGLAIDAVVTYGKTSFREGLLFTHRGLSGPSILQISSYWEEGDDIQINLCPDLDIAAFLKNQKTAAPKSEIQGLLAQHLPKRLAQSVCEETGVSGQIANIPDAALNKIGERINNWRVRPSGTEGYRTAEVTKQGVDTGQLSSKTMETKTHPGLYFIGEVVDVTGHLGGYNFQWAWSSGYVAGLNV